MKELDLRISQSEIELLVKQFNSESDSKELFSAAAMSHLTEPGDRFAGALVTTLGMSATLGMIVNRWAAPDVRSALSGAVEEIERTFNETLQTMWDDALQRWLPRLQLNLVRNNLTTFASQGGKLVARDSRFFPKSLNDLRFGTPMLLWLRGNPKALRFESSLSIVGSRISTNYGQQVSVDLAEVCAAKSVTTVSGGAFGIDALVHRASLELEAPTLAVLAGGLDRLYPAGNAALFEAILRSNAIIAEVPPQVAPAKWRFLMRNRLIAALGKATVVVEAGKRSGSMSTAGHALELQRPIGVVPGRWTDSSSRGCLNLQRDNPTEVSLLTCADDALELIGLSSHVFELKESMGVLETRALDAFGNRLLTLLDVQRIAGLTFSEVQLALGRLELDGYLERHANGYRKVSHNLRA